MGSLRADDNDMPWYEVLQVNNESMKFKLDSGADVSIISENEYQNMRPKPKLKHTDVKLNGVSANIDLCGYFDADIRRSNDVMCRVNIYVARRRTENLLGRAASVELCLIKRMDSVSIFQGLGLMKCEPVKIVLNENVVPYNLTPPRRVSQPLAPKVEAEIQKMLKEGVILPVEKETDWCSPLVPVLKPNGKVHPCVDFQEIE